jgi:hypothetical protein
VANWFYQTAGVLGAALVYLISQIKKSYASDKETDPNSSP